MKDLCLEDACPVVFVQSDFNCHILQQVLVMKAAGVVVMKVAGVVDMKVEEVVDMKAEEVGCVSIFSGNFVCVCCKLLSSSFFFSFLIFFKKIV